MYVIDDIWLQIKEYLFHRHLWNKYSKKTKMLKSLPLYTEYYKSNTPMILVSPKTENLSFIKIYEYLKNQQLCVTYMLLPPEIDYNEYNADDYIYSIHTELSEFIPLH